MTATHLPGQLELPTVVDHKSGSERLRDIAECKGREFDADYIAHMKELDQIYKPQGVRLAALLRDYDARPSSETWSRIQALAAEILK